MERVIIPTSVTQTIDGLDPWHRAKVQAAIAELPDRYWTQHDDAFVYVGNYKIAYDVLEDKLGERYNRRGDSSISVTSVSFEQRAHIVVASWGRYEDHDERLERVFLNPEKAELYREQVEEQQAVALALQVKLREFLESWTLSFPSPGGEYEKKPKIKPGQTQAQHISENLEPWKVRVEAERNQYEIDHKKWMDLRKAASTKFLVDNYSIEINGNQLSIEWLVGSNYSKEEFRTENVELEM